MFLKCLNSQEQKTTPRQFVEGYFTEMTEFTTFLTEYLIEIDQLLYSK